MKPQKWKHIKKLQPKAKLEPWEKHTDKNVEFRDEINQRELSLKDQIRLDDMEYDIKSLFKRIDKRNYIIPVVNIL